MHTWSLAQELHAPPELGTGATHTHGARHRSYMHTQSLAQELHTHPELGTGATRTPGARHSYPPGCTPCC